MSSDRVFNPRGLRHYRRTYSTREVRWGGLVVMSLAAIAGWIAWRGANPDPSLFGDPSLVMTTTPVAVDRGELPEDLAGEGWREAGLSRFDADSLYKKIDGRADFFLERGFEQLTFLSLAHETDALSTIDVEIYDLGQPENALSAFDGEKPDEARVQTEAGARWRSDPNALFIARGKLYVRAIGSTQSDTITNQLLRLKDRLLSTVTQGERPWAYAILLDEMKIDEEKISFVKENAFSFAFAKEVYTAMLDDSGTEVFLTRASEAPERVIAQYEQGFSSLGERVGTDTEADEPWFRDRYLGQLSAVRRSGNVIYGVRGAADLDKGTQLLQQIAAAMVSNETAN
jgi:hypothetical protein